MASMRALVGGAGPDWEEREVDIPAPAPGQVLIRVHAAGLNRADLYMLDGSYNPNSKTSAVFTAGLELAGEIAALGDGVSGVRGGDRVCGAGLGAFADYALLDARHVILVPPSLSWTDAAALPVGIATEHDALITQGGFSSGQSVLVIGGTTAIGLIAIQMAKALGASLVAATTTSTTKTSALIAAGADLAINTSTDGLAEAVLAATSGIGVDLVLDHIGAQLFADALAATRVGGTVVNIGRLGGPESTIDLNNLSFRRLRVFGTTFSVRTPDELAAVCAAVRPEVMPAVADGRIRPVVDRVFAFEDAKKAADYLRTNQALGKLVLRISEDA
jgi:NADPH:quinone reductase